MIVVKRQLSNCVTTVSNIIILIFVGEIKPDLVLKKIQNYDHQGLYHCMMSIPGTESIRLSFPASLSIKSNDKPEFNRKYTDIQCI